MSIRDLLKSAKQVLSSVPNWTIAAEKYKDDDFTFIHFTKGIKVSDNRTDIKLGVKPPQSTNEGNINHKDPTGVFAYPCSVALLNQTNYATDYKFWVIFRVQNHGNGVILQKIKKEQCQMIASRNGWGTIYKYINVLPNTHIAELLKSNYNNGGAWYRLAKSLALGDGKKYSMRNQMSDKILEEDREAFISECEKPWTWFKLLGFVDWVYDMGDGFIHQNEPEQICVLNKATIQVLASDENRKVLDDYEKQSNQDTNTKIKLYLKIYNKLLKNQEPADYAIIGPQNRINLVKKLYVDNFALMNSNLDAVSLYFSFSMNKFYFGGTASGESMDGLFTTGTKPKEIFTFDFCILPQKVFKSTLPGDLDFYFKNPTAFGQDLNDKIHEMNNLRISAENISNLWLENIPGSRLANLYNDLRVVELSDTKILITNIKDLKSSIITTRELKTGTISYRDPTTQEIITKELYHE